MSGSRDVPKADSASATPESEQVSEACRDGFSSVGTEPSEAPDPLPAAMALGQIAEAAPATRDERGLKMRVVL
jgi:hypothetical protein